MSRVGDENGKVPSASGLPSRTGPLLEPQVAVGVVVPVLVEEVDVLEVLEEEVLDEIAEVFVQGAIAQTSEAVTYGMKLVLLVLEEPPQGVASQVHSVHYSHHQALHSH